MASKLSTNCPNAFELYGDAAEYPLHLSRSVANFCSENPKANGNQCSPCPSVGGDGGLIGIHMPGFKPYPYFLLNYGKYIWQLYASQQRGVHLSGNSWLSRDQLITKNDDAYEDAEREVMAVSSVPVIRNTFLLHSKNARPRREVVASISLILFSDVFDLNTTMTLKKAARIIGMAIDSDDIRGGILARICLGELISASSIIIKTDESLHLSPAFAQYLSGGDMSVEIGSSPNQILVHASCHKKRAALRKVKLAEEIKGELKQLKAEGSPILDVMRKRVVE